MLTTAAGSPAVSASAVAKLTVTLPMISSPLALLVTCSPLLVALLVTKPMVAPLESLVETATEVLAPLDATCTVGVDGTVTTVPDATPALGAEVLLETLLLELLELELELELLLEEFPVDGLRVVVVVPLGLGFFDAAA